MAQDATQICSTRIVFTRSPKKTNKNGKNIRKKDQQKDGSVISGDYKKGSYGFFLNFDGTGWNGYF